MRIAVLSDVHGNRLALEAALEHLGRARPDLIVNLGDLVSGPFDPAGAAELQMGLDAATVAGNHDRQVLSGGGDASDAFARGRLRPAHLDWLAGLPPRLSLAGGRVFACHGSPAGGDLEGLLEDVATGRPAPDRPEAIRSRLAGIGAAEVALCGHTHTPRVMAEGGVLLVNPGSVGLQGYRAGAPAPHLAETGAPHARYALVERLAAGWTAELRAVPYDWEAAARQAEAAGWGEVAHLARTGRVAG